MSVHQKFDTLFSTLKNLQDKHAPLNRQSRLEENLPKNLESSRQSCFQFVIKTGSFLQSANRTTSATVDYNLLTGMKYKTKQNFYQPGA